MRRIAMMAVLACAGLGPVAGTVSDVAAQEAAQQPDIEQRVAQSREIVQNFSTQLMQALRTAMEQGGPVQGIKVCNEVAPGIPAQFADERSVGRTSLKLRNPANAPDAWERQVLEEFARRKQAGAKPGELEHAEIVEAPNGPNFRYMKAIVIPADGPCLSCHGSTLDPAVVDALRRLYPEDTATGYAVGDLRGAFTIEQPL
jgi:hypothetical protein